MIPLNELKQYGERVGGLIARPAWLWHSKEYLAAGQYSIEFFRTQGAQQDYSGTIATVANISNIVTSGKFDEKFLITHVSAFFNPMNATKSTQAVDTVKVFNGGSFQLEINNKVVLELAPIGRLGTFLNYTGYAGSGSSGAQAGQFLKNRPFKLPQPIFAEESDTLRALMSWTTLITIGTSSVIGVYLHGLKYFKA